MSFRKKLSLVGLALLGGMALPDVSQAGTGTCFLKTFSTTDKTALNATSVAYGFTASGVATGTNAANAPTGNVVRSGTIQMVPSVVTKLTTSPDPTIAGVATFTYNQLDANGMHTVAPQYFVMYIDMYTCLVTFTNYTFSSGANEIYSGILVNGGDGLRLMSNNANLYLAYATAQRL